MDKIKKILKNKQWSGVVSLGVGTVIAQSVNLLIQPILTRLVSPEDLGIYSFILSMANLIIPIASLKLYVLIVVRKEEKEAELLTDVSLITVFLISLLYAVFISVMLLLNNNSFSEIGWLSFLIPIIVFTNGIRFVLISYNNRYKNYKLISRVDISREFTKGILQVLSGFWKMGASGQAISYALSPLPSITGMFRRYLKKKKNKINMKSVLNTYKKNAAHMVYLVPAQFINNFSYALITISVISLFSATEAGYYSVSLRVLSVPLVLVSNNVSRVFLQKISEDFREGRSVWKTYKRVLIVLVPLSIIGFLLLSLIAPKISGFIFGDGYEVAGIYISILCLMYGLRFIASSIIPAYTVFNRQKNDMIFQSILVVCGICVYLIAKTLNYNIYQYLFSISISYGLVYLLIIINIGFICKKNSGNNL